MRPNKGIKQGRTAFAGADFKDARAADAKQMRLVPATGLAMVHVTMFFRAAPRRHLALETFCCLYN